MAVAGFAKLAAMPKPLAGIRTLSSPGIENAVVRVAADAMSSRAISSACAGTLSRSSAPAASVQTFSWMSEPPWGFETITE